MSGFGKSTFAKKRRAKRLGFECSHCVRLPCKNPRYKALGIVVNLNISLIDFDDNNCD